jgi:hypothetical protein
MVYRYTITTFVRIKDYKKRIEDLENKDKQFDERVSKAVTEIFNRPNKQVNG